MANTGQASGWCTNGRRCCLYVASQWETNKTFYHYYYNYSSSVMQSGVFRSCTSRRAPVQTFFNSDSLLSWHLHLLHSVISCTSPSPHPFTNIDLSLHQARLLWNEACHFVHHYKRARTHSSLHFGRWRVTDFSDKAVMSVPQLPRWLLQWRPAHNWCLWSGACGGRASSVITLSRKFPLICHQSLGDQNRHQMHPSEVDFHLEEPS